MAATATLYPNSPHSLLIRVAYDATLTGTTIATADLRSACAAGPLKAFLTAHATDLTDLKIDTTTPTANAKKIRLYAVTGDTTTTMDALPGGLAFTATGITVKNLAASVYGTEGYAIFELRLLHSTMR